MPNLAMIEDPVVRQAFYAIVSTLRSEGEKARKNETSLFGDPEKIYKKLDEALETAKKQEKEIKTVDEFDVELIQDNGIEIKDESIGRKRRYRISLVEGEESVSGGTALKTAVITGGYGDEHTADIYSNVDSSAISTGETLKILQITDSSTVVIPAGTRFPCWQQSWGTSDVYWTADVPRWLDVTT